MSDGPGVRDLVVAVYSRGCCEVGRGTALGAAPPDLSVIHVVELPLEETGVSGTSDMVR